MKKIKTTSESPRAKNAQRRAANAERRAAKRGQRGAQRESVRSRAMEGRRTRGTRGNIPTAEIVTEAPSAMGPVASVNPGRANTPAGPMGKQKKPDMVGAGMYGGGMTKKRKGYNKGGYCGASNPPERPMKKMSN